MNLSRRKLLLGAAAVAVAPTLPVEPIRRLGTEYIETLVDPPLIWHPNPPMVTSPLVGGEIFGGEIFYGGAAGGGKMTMTRFDQLWNEVLKRAYIGEAYTEGSHPWRE